MSTESKEKIVKGALDLFKAQGIKSVTMDKIAATLAVSKRTIYELFGDKEQLVSACLAEFKQSNDLKKDELKANSAHAFTFLLEVFKNTVSLMRTINMNFFMDAEAMFPEIIKQVKLNKKSQLEQFRSLIEEAQEDGHIMKSFDSVVLAEIYYNLFFSLRNPDSYDFKRTPSSEVMRVVCSVYFRGVATRNGLDIIDEILGVEV